MSPPNDSAYRISCPLWTNTGWFIAGTCLLSGTLGLQLDWAYASWVPTNGDRVWFLLCALLIVGAAVAIVWLARFPGSRSTTFAALISSLLLVLADISLIVIDYAYRSSIFSPTPIWFQGLRTGILLLPLAMWILGLSPLRTPTNAKPTAENIQCSSV
jgi:hypothetical protein